MGPRAHGNLPGRTRSAHRYPRFAHHRDHQRPSRDHRRNRSRPKYLLQHGSPVLDQPSNPIRPTSNETRKRGRDAPTDRAISDSFRRRRSSRIQFERMNLYILRSVLRPPNYQKNSTVTLKSEKLVKTIDRPTKSLISQPHNLATTRVIAKITT